MAKAPGWNLTQARHHDPTVIHQKDHHSWDGGPPATPPGSPPHFISLIRQKGVVIFGKTVSERPHRRPQPGWTSRSEEGLLAEAGKSSVFRQRAIAYEGAACLLWPHTVTCLIHQTICNNVNTSGERSSSCLDRCEGAYTKLGGLLSRLR